MTDRELMQQALEALRTLMIERGSVYDKAITALRERLAQPEQEPMKHGGRPMTLRECMEAEEPARQEQEQEPVDSDEKAGAYLDARLWEFIDMAAAWPGAKPDPRTWDHVMVYAPKQPEPDERAALMQIFTDPENQPTQYGTVTVEYMQREIAAEREACAELCVKLAVGGGFAADCAAAIRARGSA